ncbi:MAG TPA: MFS transporter [Candidatus Aphodousia faecavium]|uniref:MFS transporter n=1 Tax=Parasutterella secunda TaxID=626947 RepID=A0ABS2GSY7_9BURK|nr:MFS transporter [Parasutterella secunda]MBM6928963.1 MFS transporter [Parasutterella secunda]HIT95498.1 MFS transporter [Candidatus Aphodousia faecavium]
MPYWKALVWFLTITSVFMSASYTMLVPFLPMYLIDELGVAQSDVNIWSGLIFSISFLISAIMAPIWGALSDKKSHKAMAVRAAVCLAISYVWGGFVQTPWELFAMRSFQGFSAGLWPACLAIMTSTAPREKMGWCLGLMQGGSTAGGVFGPLIGGVLAEVFGMRASFYFAGAALGLIALGLIFFIKGGEQKKIAPAASDKKKDKGGSFKLLKVPVIQRMLFAAAVVQLAVMLVQPVLPLYIAELQGSMDNIVMVSGIVFSVVGISGVFAAPMWGRIGTNIGYRWALYVALLGGGIFGVVQAIPGDITPFVIWRFVGGIFFAGIFPAINALFAENTLPNERGRIYGLSYAAQQIGSVMGPILGGLMATFWSNSIVVMAHGFVMILLVILLYLKRPKNQDPGSGETIIEVEAGQPEQKSPTA